MKNIEIRRSFKCEHPLDCIYVNKYNKNYFGVGLYNLQDEKTQNRTGGINIYSTKKIIDLNDNTQELYINNLEPILYINADSGVVNFEWNDENSNLNMNLITCLCSNKKLKYYKLNREFNNYELLSEVKSKNIDDNNDIIGLDLSSILNDNIRTCYSISDGRVFIIKDLEIIESEFVAHKDTEVWTISYLDDLGNIIGTGGDDCVLSIWDIRTDLNNKALSNTKTHSMGVTCISKICDQNKFWTGSYDENLRFWDIRKLNLPIYEYKVQGGIWRINKFENYIGIAECHFGFEYYKLDNTLNIVEQSISIGIEDQIFDKPLIYGIDTFRIDDSIYGVTCSFNDKTILGFKIKENSS